MVDAATVTPDPPLAPTGRPAWEQTYQRLAGRDRSTLHAAELTELAEALFWLDRPEDSVAVRRHAYAAHREEGDLHAAALTAWQLYHDHALVGERAVASGWLARARQHVTPGDGSSADGFVAIAEADEAHHHGDLETAIAHAERAVAIGRCTADHDLTAMALQTHGRLLITQGRLIEGSAHLDEAMVAVVGGELQPLFTGWVYCSVLEICHGVADLRRATEWTDAAMRWCDGLRDGLLYPGLCRIHRVELACLAGAWATASAEAERAYDELRRHDRRYAGEAAYQVAELLRLRGDLEPAEAAFRDAHELGRTPQPGLALTWLAQGRPVAAVAALRLAMAADPPSLLARALLLGALVEAELAVGELDRARDAARDLAAIAVASTGSYLDAIAAIHDGMVRLAEGAVTDALVRLRRARASFHELAMPYEVARTQLLLGSAARRAGDEDTAILELEAARAGFAELGAQLDATRAAELLGRGAHHHRGPLTRREVEVLRLVAEGRTNREVGAALVISEHTVARHLSNVFTKLGLPSRAAATAYAYEHGLVG